MNVRNCRLLRLGCCLAVLGVAGDAGAAPPAWMAFGKKPATIPAAERELRSRIGAIAVPARFKTSAVRTLDAGLKLVPMLTSENTAVLGRGVSVSLSGKLTPTSRREEGRYVSVKPAGSGRATLTMLSSTTFGDGRSRALRRAVTPVGRGRFVEEISVSGTQREPGSGSLSSRHVNKAYLVDKSGHRLQALSPEYAALVKATGRLVTFQHRPSANEREREAARKAGFSSVKAYNDYQLRIRGY